MEQSLQDKHAPKSICYGCGPTNKQGLQIKSFVKGNEVVCTWTPKEFHHAFPNVVNGGIIGSLLDCHSNWTAAWALMNKNNEPQIPCTVTSEFHVKLLRPTPMNTPLLLSAKVVEVSADRATIDATLTAGGKVCATCRGVFVAVKEGHPAFHRWS